ncbi:unnamed protein product [Phytomonas sp. EM1]|nr:unnamed protein product [Phytomonas sp. EM1]|eukprot:CCW63863.1 unnamed protein product [Phytomonas sp. isolate EM1]
MSGFSSNDPNTLRVLVVGESKVGKTLFIRRLCYDVFASAASWEGGNRFYWENAWPPTVGVAVDVLIRDAPVEDRPRPTLASSPISVDDDFDSVEVGIPTGREEVFSKEDEEIGLQVEKRSPLLAFRTQTIELYELGGVVRPGAGAMLPLQRLHLDGVVFVYDRADVRSSARLRGWFALVRKFLFSEGGKGPHLMLLGALRKPVRAYLPSLSGGREPLPSLPDELLLDPAFRVRVWQGMEKARDASPRGEGGWIRPLNYLIAFMRAVGWVMWMLMSPSLVLSEMFQEERGDVYFRAWVGKIEWCARWMMWIDHWMTVALTVLLFGAPESSFQEPCHSSRSVLNRIHEDPHCIVHVHACHLYDRIAFESTIDEITSFFDTLHRYKIARYYKQH